MAVAILFGEQENTEAKEAPLTGGNQDAVSGLLVFS
jgi:hypothetical protein